MALLPVLGIVPAAAQNLDPTVNVTRAYEGKLLEVDKPSLVMTVPDSVTRFNLDFDYTVLQSGYKGGGKFEPFLQDIRPEKTAVRDSRLWLSLGAGYNFHPEFNLVWAAVKREHFSMNVYADHKSYVGRYREIGLVEDAGPDGGRRYLLATRKYLAPRDGSEARFSGHDLGTRAGIDGRYDWLGGSAVFDLNYTGYAAKDTACARSFNSVNFSARAGSNDNGSDYFFYDAGLRYRFGQQDLSAVGIPPQVGYVREHYLEADASLGPVLSFYHAVLADFGLRLSSYDGAGNPAFRHAGAFSVKPKYVYAKDRWNISAGVKLEFLLRPDAAVTDMNQRKGQIVYPDVNVNFEAVKDRLNIFFKAAGGADINSYSDMIGRDHWFNPLYSFSARNGDFTSPLLENTIRRADICLGINGNVRHRFSYDVRVGYENLDGAALTSVCAGPGNMLMPCIWYGDVQMLYASMGFGLKTRSVSVDGSLAWRYPSYQKKISDEDRQGFSQSPLSGSLKAVYNWRHRIFAGVGLEGALGKNGKTFLDGNPEIVRIPGYVDLGLDFRYVVSKKFSVWAKGGNLACMTIQRTPLHAEAGPYFTVGICLNL